MLFFIFVSTVVFVSYLIYFWSSKTVPIPPGLKELPFLKGWPIIGVLNQMKPTMHHALMELGKKHGPIFKINFGMRTMIVLNDLNTIKKVLKDNGDNFSGRLKIEGIGAISRHSGIIFEDGDKWAKQRSFVMKVLRDFGLGKSKSASIVQNECKMLLQELSQDCEKDYVDFSTLIPVYTANIISTFIMNKRFIRGDPSLKVIENVIDETGRKVNLVTIAHFLFPILDGTGWILKLYNSKIFNDVYCFFQNEIDEHKRVLDLSAEGEDLIDRFLIEQNRLQAKTGSVDTFTNWQLIRNSFELFAAGYETTSTTLGWSLMFMSKFPDIQDEVRKEIIDQIGEERLPTMNDKKVLHYTQAVMDEIMRFASPAPAAIQHRSFNGCEINGYFIPKNSILIPNLFACHFDPKIWIKPQEFYPEHFLLKDNNGQWKYNPREELIPFSMGKRQCLGESLAKMEYFMFFTSIIQKFHVRFHKELTEKQYKEVLIGNDGFIRFCDTKNFIFTKRF